LRYLALALVALLVSVPAVAVAGPDALSIAKRALRLAQEPPKVAEPVFDKSVDLGNNLLRIKGRCPRGMVAINQQTDEGATELLGTTLDGRRGSALFRKPEDFPGMGPVWPSMQLICIEGEIR
jgi:hypothetical protein